MIGGSKASKPAPVASPFDGEKLPPWRIEHIQGALGVTDGIVVFVNNDSVQALKCLGEVSQVWPHGTAKASCPELNRAHRRGFLRGSWQGLAVGTLLGVILSTIVSYASLAWWGL